MKKILKVSVGAKISHLFSITSSSFLTVYKVTLQPEFFSQSSSLKSRDGSYWVKSWVSLEKPLKIIES